MIHKIRHLMKRVRGRFSEDLPTDPVKLDAFIESTLSLYNLPQKPDYQRTIVTMIQHLSQERFRAPKFYFYRQIKRSEAMRAAFLKLKAMNDAEKAQQESAREVTKAAGE